MGTWLIFLGLLVVTNAEYRSALLDWPGGWDFRETAPAHRPYPKPTQVDW